MEPKELRAVEPKEELTDIDSDQEVVAMLSARARTLYLGTANYCWFIDPAKALCLRLAGTPDADRPLVGMCDSAPAVTGIRGRAR
jgi:hypothetical protein